MKAAERVPYRKMPGQRRGFLRGHSVWMGPDHLLLVKSLRFREEYKRLYLRDIQAIVVAPAPRFHLSTRAAALGWLWLILLAATRPLPYGTLVASSIGVCLVFAWIFVSWVRSCRCQIQTAVSREPLPSVYRTWTARRFLAELEPRIAEAQGPLPEGWAAGLEAQAAAPSTPEAEALRREAPREKVPTRRHTFASDVFIASLFADAGLNAATLYNLTRTVQWIWYGLALIQLACAILIFVERQRGILRAGMQKLAITTLIVMGGSYYIRQVAAGVASVSLSAVPDPGLLASLPAYTVLREVDVALSLGLAIAGVVLVWTAAEPEPAPSITG